MNPQQLHDHIIEPTLDHMGGKYYSKDAAFLLLCTAAIESDCGHYIKQINGPALGIWQMELKTHIDIWENCDAITNGDVKEELKDLKLVGGDVNCLLSSPMYACAMARLKYAMDKEPLPYQNDLLEVYEYYKRIYNTPLGASTWEKFIAAINKHGILDVIL